MSTPTYAQFKNITRFSDTQLLTELENNLKCYLDWSFLRIGSWTDVSVDVVSGYGGYADNLRYVSDPNYTNGQVWQGFRKDWVYESGVDYSYGGNTYNPVNIQTSGVRIDGVWQTTGYYVDYPNGKVIFDTVKATTSVVDLNYSYRNVQVVVADQAPWWNELQFSSMRSDDAHFTQDARTGDWSIGSHNRIQMPCIVVEGVPRGRSRAYELGNSSLWIEQDVVFHILAEDRNTRNKLVSILQVQSDHNIWLFDSDIVAASGAFPLNYRGQLTGTNTYPDIVSSTTYQWKKCYLKNMEVSNVASINPNLYEGSVRVTCELVFGSS